MKRRRHSGNVLVIGCLMTIAAFLVFLFVLDVGRFYADRARAMALAEVSALGSARMRAQGLQKIAERWNAIKPKLGPVDALGRVSVFSTDAGFIATQALTLSKALSGYQTRAKSIITVLAQSNTVARSDVMIDQDEGSVLDVAPQPGFIVDETGAVSSINGLWYRRGWSAATDPANPAGVVAHEIPFHVAMLAAGQDAWDAQSGAQVELRWNETLNGNGGYPRDWNSAVDGTTLNPHRTASYRVVLQAEAP